MLSSSHFELNSYPFGLNLIEPSQAEPNHFHWHPTENRLKDAGLQGVLSQF